MVYPNPLDYIEARFVGNVYYGGACFLYVTLSGGLTQEQLRTHFKEMQRQGEFRSGAEYSGDWNMMRGLTVDEETEPFSSEKDAVEYLEKNTGTWGNALAVRARKQDKDVWVVGGWAAE